VLDRSVPWGRALRLAKYRLAAAYDELRFLTGETLSRQAAAGPAPTRLADAEFRVFSQWGQDGIIQHLIRAVPIEHEVFVEFGVENYREANTRFLLMHDNWCGVVIDAGEHHTEFLDASGLRWRHTIEPVTAFITRDNIDDLLTAAGVSGDIGLLSVDIDGNDYWVLEAISVVSPRILIVEYNSLFGAERAVSVPYDAAFDFAAAHPSRLYFGASLPAIVHLAERKGYRFVGSNRAGSDAFFVRDDVAGELPALTARDGWAPSRFRIARGPGGALRYLSGHAAQRQAIASCPLVDVCSGEQLTVADLPVEPGGELPSGPDVG
jgi:hypothetical protein